MGLDKIIVIWCWKIRYWGIKLVMRKCWYVSIGRRKGKDWCIVSLWFDFFWNKFFYFFGIEWLIRIFSVRIIILLLFGVIYKKIFKHSFIHNHQTITSFLSIFQYHKYFPNLTANTVSPDIIYFSIYITFSLLFIQQLHNAPTSYMLELLSNQSETK